MEYASGIQEHLEHTGFGSDEACLSTKRWKRQKQKKLAVGGISKEKRQYRFRRLVHSLSGAIQKAFQQMRMSDLVEKQSQSFRKGKAIEEREDCEPATPRYDLING